MNFFPWNKVVDCPRSPYTGDQPRDIKLWGRRRLLVLERLLPLCDSVRVHLLGDGMPSFFVLKLGGMTFTLGMSGWSENDWSHAGQFNLMTANVQYSPTELDRSYRILKENWLLTTDELAAKTGLDRARVHGLMSEHARQGNVIYDINKGVYRARELSKDGLPVEKLRFASEVEQEAFVLEASGAVERFAPQSGDSVYNVKGAVREGSFRYEVALEINADQQLVSAHCGCDQFKMNGLTKGPCRHMLALRMHAGV